MSTASAETRIWRSAARRRGVGQPGPGQGMTGKGIPEMIDLKNLGHLEPPPAC